MIKKMILIFSYMAMGLSENFMAMDTTSIKYGAAGAVVCCCCNIVSTTVYALYVENNKAYYEARNMHVDHAKQSALTKKQVNNTNDNDKLVSRKMSR